LDGDAVTLQVEAFSELDAATLGGRHVGDQLVLVAPATSGNDATVVFLRGSQIDYSRIVGR
jgi:hypothetical protein